VTADARRAALLPLAAGVALAAWPFVEPFFPVLRQVRVPVLAPGAEPLRVLHVSDLHLLPRSRRRAAWVRGLARLQPALVVSTGDHWSAPDAADLLVDTLAALTADGAPGVFVPGNNDYYSPVKPSLTSYLRAGAAPAARARPAVGRAGRRARRRRLDRPDPPAPGPPVGDERAGAHRAPTTPTSGATATGWWPARCPRTRSASASSTRRPAPAAGPLAGRVRPGARRPHPRAGSCACPAPARW
jgi:hypothetical protein